jgi:hypothetical protein
VKKSLLLLLIFAQLFQANLKAENPRLAGYVKYLPSVRTPNDFSEFYVDQLLHNRLNVSWRIDSNLNFQGALRTRFSQGYSTANLPFFREFIETDEGIVNLSRVWFHENSWMAHSICDRFYLEYNQQKWNIKAGRQRINWGINMVSNPNDLFNVYSFFDFDYEERPGADALRVQYFRSSLSVIDFAYKPARDFKESVVAMRYGTNFKRYDLQWIGGYFNHRWVSGFGWAGHVKKSGFKGEVSAFYDAEKVQGLNRFNLVGAVTFDHLFKNGGFLIAEYLFNQQRIGLQNQIMLFAQPLRADNLSFAEHVVFTNYQYPISPILSTGMAVMLFPTEKGLFLSPNLRYSIGQNTDLMVISQIFAGKQGSLLSQAGYLFATALKWSF